MSPPQVRVLILACGNTLRSDDGVGPWLAEWAEQHFAAQPEIHVISRQQWTPDLAEDIAQAQAVLFIDCSIESAPGSVQLRPVEPAAPQQGLATHHQGAPELLALARDLYASSPSGAQLLSIGAGSIELGEDFSDRVRDALPRACALLEQTVSHFLKSFPQ
jgi:hydrogenase maturation protease